MQPATPGFEILASEKALSDAELFATLPKLPSLDGYENRLVSIQSALDEAREEAAYLREELRQNAELLRKLATALESM